MFCLFVFWLVCVFFLFSVWVCFCGFFLKLYTVLNELFHTLFLIIVITFLCEKCANSLPMTHYEIQKYLLSAESFAGYFLQNTSYEKFIPKKVYL